MSDDSPLDPSTGLLHRAAFLKEVRKSQASAPGNLRRGCLLILHFPGLLELSAEESVESADQTLRDLLAIVESRLRSRDTLGRIAQHSLCLLLRKCREPNAKVIADQYVALLNAAALDTRLQKIISGLHYRIVLLDPGERKSRLGLKRVVSSPALGDTTKLLAAISSFTSSEKPSDSNVVTLSAELNDNSHTESRELYPPIPSSDSSLVLVSQRDNSAWRLKPGVVLSHQSLICCHRLQSVGTVPITDSLTTNVIVNAALECLALSLKNARPIIETQLIIPVDAMHMTRDSANWLRERCRSLRVAPSDICLVMTVESVSRDLRESMPVVRQLNRQGIRLMLEGVNAAAQLRALFQFGSFDYLWISAKSLQASMQDIRQRRELEALIAEAHAHHQEVCAAGVDTPSLLQYAQTLQVDIGFGRSCGKSEPFPVLNSISAKPVA